MREEAARPPPMSRRRCGCSHRPRLNARHACSSGGDPPRPAACASAPQVLGCDRAAPQFSITQLANMLCVRNVSSVRPCAARPQAGQRLRVVVRADPVSCRCRTPNLASLQPAACNGGVGAREQSARPGALPGEPGLPAADRLPRCTRQHAHAFPTTACTAAEGRALLAPHPQKAEQALQTALKEAEDACEGDEKTGACAAAWDNVSSAPRRERWVCQRKSTPACQLPALASRVPARRLRRCPQPSPTRSRPRWAAQGAPDGGDPAMRCLHASWRGAGPPIPLTLRACRAGCQQLQRPFGEVLRRQPRRRRVPVRGSDTGGRPPWHRTFACAGCVAALPCCERRACTDAHRRATKLIQPVQHLAACLLMPCPPPRPPPHPCAVCTRTKQLVAT